MSKYTRKLKLETPEYTDNVDIPKLLDKNNNIIDENISDVMKLSYIVDYVPTEYEEGDKYYNTSTKLIYEIVNNGWDDGKEPRQEVLYINDDDKSLYYYNGDDMLKISGGSGGSSTTIKRWEGES